MHKGILSTKYLINQYKNVIINVKELNIIRNIK